MLRKIFIFLLLTALTFQIDSSAQPTGSVASYDELIHQVRAAFARGQERTADAVERERVQTYWEVGKLIDEHILLHKERAEYGAKVMKRLSSDLGTSHTELKYMVQFARTYPIRPVPAQLSWAHYRELLSVNNDEQREKIANEASIQQWSQKELREEIKKLKVSNPQIISDDLEDEPLIPIKGALDTYRIVKAESGKWQGKLVVDLGFSNYLSLDNFLSRQWPQEDRKGRRGVTSFKEGDIVHTKGGSFSLVFPPNKMVLFTYRAYILEITDGDTLWLLIDLGFGFFAKQHVRLRGIDAPEITTRDGQAAKEFVEKKLKNISEIIITTSKSDKYDRYLVDIFYQSKNREKFLNNELLTRHLAKRV